MDNVCESGKRKAGTGEGLANTPARLDDVMNKNQKRSVGDDEVLESKPIAAPTVVTPARRTRSKAITSNERLAEGSSTRQTYNSTESKRGAEIKTSSDDGLGVSASPVDSAKMRHACPTVAGSLVEEIATVDAKNAAPDAPGSIDTAGSAPPASTLVRGPPAPPRPVQTSVERTATSVSSGFDQHEQQRDQQRHESLDGSVSSECDDALQDETPTAAATLAATPSVVLVGSSNISNLDSSTSSSDNHKSDIEEHQLGSGSNVKAVGLRIGGPGRIHGTPPGKVLPFRPTSGPPIDVEELLSTQDPYAHHGAYRSLGATSAPHGANASLSRGAPMHVEQSPELRVSPHGASSSFGSDRPLPEPQSKRKSSMSFTACEPNRFVAPAVPLREQGRVTSFDANCDNALQAQLLQIAADSQARGVHRDDQQQPQSHQNFLDSLRTPRTAIGTPVPSVGPNSWGAGQGFCVSESRPTTGTFGGDGASGGASIPLFQLGTAAREQQLHHRGLRHPEQQHQQHRLRTREEVNAMVVSTVLGVSPGGARNPHAGNTEPSTDHYNCDNNSYYGGNGGGGSSSSGGADQMVASPQQPPGQRRRSLEGDDGSFSTDTRWRPYAKRAKKVKGPYRCKKCGQLKSKHLCPFKNIDSHVDIRTLGLQTDHLAPGTDFEPPDLPVPNSNGDNVFHCRKYHPELTNHEPGTGPFQHPRQDVPGAPASSADSAYGAAHVGRSLGRRLSGPENRNQFSSFSSFESRPESFHQRWPSFGAFPSSLTGVPEAPARTGTTREGVGVAVAAGNAVGVEPPSDQDDYHRNLGLGYIGREGNGSSMWSSGPSPIGGDHGHGNGALDNSFRRYPSENLMTTASPAATGSDPRSMPTVSVTPGLSPEEAHRRRRSSGILFSRIGSCSSLHLPPEMQALEAMFHARWSANVCAGMPPGSDFPRAHSRQNSTGSGEGPGERVEASDLTPDGGTRDSDNDGNNDNSSNDNNNNNNNDSNDNDDIDDNDDNNDTNDTNDTNDNNDNNDDHLIVGGAAVDMVVDTGGPSPWRASAAAETAGLASHPMGGLDSAQGSGGGAGDAPCGGGAVLPVRDDVVERTPRNEYSV